MYPNPNLQLCRRSDCSSLVSLASWVFSIFSTPPASSLQRELLPRNHRRAGLLRRVLLPADGARIRPVRALVAVFAAGLDLGGALLAGAFAGVGGVGVLRAGG